MKIIVARHLGMCFGVRDAINAAEQLRQAGPLTILGELVHNPVVLEHLRAQGIGETDAEWPDDPSAASSGSRVMITAHGASDRKRTAWREAGFEIADATCPLVRLAHQQLARLVAAGYFPVVIGRCGHVEVRGLVGDFADAVVIETVDDIRKVPEHSRYGVISQTTQPIEYVLRLVSEMRRSRPRAEIHFVDTVCKPTKDRQDALTELIAQADAIVVVGGTASNNTRQLVETCRAAGRRAIHVERAEDLATKDLVGVTVVGLTAGTSTLPQTIQAVFDRLNQISLNQP